MTFGKARCMYCLQEMEGIKYWTFHGGFCTKCFFKYMKTELLRGMEVMTDEEIQDLFGSDYYYELRRTLKRMI